MHMDAIAWEIISISKGSNGDAPQVNIYIIQVVEKKSLMTWDYA